jgi:calcineurin-like phosphoesterase family protein
MANVWFTSDLHFGHKNIQKFRLEVSSEEDNRKRIISDWNKLVTKRDDVYVLGDAAFTMDTVEQFNTLAGRKFLIRGNHDELDTQVYLKHFKAIYGLKKYKEFWLSHAPIHPNELRGKINLHGHVHYASIQKEILTSDFEMRKWKDDPNYINICVENLWKMGYNSLISLDEVRTLNKIRKLK